MNELSETGVITNESQMGGRLHSSLRRGNNCRNDADHRRDGRDYLYYRGQFQKRATDNPAVILLDPKLPKVDGLEVLKQVKSDEKLRMIPIVVLTSSNEEKEVVACYRLGVNAYVVKPVHFHEFANPIRELGVFWAVINESPPGSVKK